MTQREAAPAQPETSAPPAPEWRSKWTNGNDDWQQCRVCGAYVQLRYGKKPTGESMQHQPDCLVGRYAAALQHIDGLTRQLDEMRAQLEAK